MKEILKIAKLFLKKKLRILNTSEKEVLSDFIAKNPTIKGIDYSKIVDRFHQYNTIDIHSAWEKIANKVANSKNKKTTYQFLQPYLKYVAILVITMGIGYTYFYSKNQIIVPDSQIKSGADKAVLTLENGKEITLEKKSNYANSNLSIADKKIVYAQNKLKAEPIEVAYNYLTIPRGGKFFVKLSDGTKVWLNSASKLKYPVNFVEGQPRKVELIYGEAYFEVTKSKNKFIVKNSNANIVVYGTKFNISAYKEDAYFSSTLVEGKVKMVSQKDSIFLRPNQRGVFKKESGKIKVKNVEPYIYTSWKDGKFYFEHQKLAYILKKMSRWYNVAIVFEDASLKNEIFTGVAFRNEPIHNLLEMIKATTNMSYRVEKNRTTNHLELIIKRS